MLCVGCHSATLSDEETIKAVAAAQAPGEGFQDFKFGQPASEYPGLDTVTSSPEGVSFTRKGEAVAYGLVPVHDVIYTFRNGGFSQVSFNSSGLSNSNKLQGCLEQLFGPLEKGEDNRYKAQTGKAMLLFSRTYSGDATAIIVSEEDFADMLST
ncbi:hypothetical protein BEN47_06180 [Hymenobacter lapidarius]|uniref:Uncharacterized protein n=1 Tax=Hymenobacter lapidarius TaxID=1908237 RepID=A0A1G1SQE7_9BACT|nr:hypothetical protein BEN47_06180 [Hymenobacter lapidarius]